MVTQITDQEIKSTPAHSYVQDRSEMVDRIIECVERDCGVNFYFTVNEQLFYREATLAPPKRCKACRVVRRKRREAEAKRANA